MRDFHSKQTALKFSKTFCKINSSKKNCGAQALSAPPSPRPTCADCDRRLSSPGHISPSEWWLVGRPRDRPQVTLVLLT